MLNLKQAQGKPDTDEAAAYYHRYLDAVPDDNLLDALRHAHVQMRAFLAGLDESRLAYRYAEGKWSIAELLLHLADSERVFAYRALRISRGDNTAMPARKG